MIYLPRRIEGRGLKSIEQEYKLIKIKAAVNLYGNQNPTMGFVREFEEKAAKLGRRSIIKDAEKYSKELGLNLELIHTNPIGHTEDEEEIGTNKIGRWIRRAMESKSYKELKQEKWQGKFLKQRWDDENLDNDCFQWMTEWKTAPTHTIAGLQELYE